MDLTFKATQICQPGPITMHYLSKVLNFFLYNHDCFLYSVDHDGIFVHMYCTESVNLLNT